MRTVALLRGINVGGHNRLRMADLRSVTESLGHTDVETYLQSGNVVFTATGRPGRPGDEISERLRATCGVDVRVLTRTAAEMDSIVAANPYDRDDPTKVVVTFLSDDGEAPDLDVDSFAPEGLTAHGRQMYLDLPLGQARSRLTAALARADDGTSTSRNWRTVLAINEMCRSRRT